MQTEIEEKYIQIKRQIFELDGFEIKNNLIEERRKYIVNFY